MAIARFIWTDHAELRLAQRGLTTREVEEAIRDLHQDRQANRGDADWRVEGTRAADGRPSGQVPVMDGREFIYVERFAPGWYVYKTT